MICRPKSFSNRGNAMRCAGRRWICGLCILAISAPVNCCFAQTESMAGDAPEITLDHHPDSANQSSGKPMPRSTEDLLLLRAQTISLELTYPTQRHGPKDDLLQTIGSDLYHWPESLLVDTKSTFWSLPNTIMLLTAGGTALAVRNTNVDDQIERHFKTHKTFSRDLGVTFGVLGNPATHFAITGTGYLVAASGGDEKTYEVSRTMFNALAINGLSTLALKVAANTDAPNGEDFAWPSGHVSSSMTAAAVADEAYGPWVGVPLYLLTGLIAVHRLDESEHHFSDVVFGGALGYVVGKTVARGHKPLIFDLEMTPYADVESGSAGLMLMKRL